MNDLLSFIQRVLVTFITLSGIVILSVLSATVSYMLFKSFILSISVGIGLFMVAYLGLVIQEFKYSKN